MTPAQQIKIFKIAGIVILALGICATALDYLAAARSPESNDPDMLAYNQSLTKAQTFQMEQSYGTIGGIWVRTMNGLKNPDARAVLILAVTGLIAGTCFFIAHRLRENNGAPD